MTPTISKVSILIISNYFDICYLFHFYVKINNKSGENKNELGIPIILRCQVNDIKMYMITDGHVQYLIY